MENTAVDDIPPLKVGYNEGDNEEPAKKFIALWKSGANGNDAKAKLEYILNDCELTGRMIHGEGVHQSIVVFSPCVLKVVVLENINE